MMQSMKTHSSADLVVAVSGGIDSVVLLHILASLKISIVVAHVNHGIRTNSDDDEVFVQALALQYEVPFESTRLKLGAGTSEEAARDARYKWLSQVAMKYGAASIATAHHEDDILETMCINLIRGTGWRGLCSLRQTKARYRPLLGWSKAAIVAYALEHGLDWREDSTNESMQYLRNRVRNGIIPRMTSRQRNDLRTLYDKQVTLRRGIEDEASKLCAQSMQDAGISRYALIMSPASVSLELLRSWLNFPLEQSRMRDVLLFAKVAKAGGRWSIDGRHFVRATVTQLIVESPRD